MARHFSFAVIACMICTVSAFVPHQRSLRVLKIAYPRTTLFSTPTEKKAPLILTGDNIEVTEALKDYATKKIEKAVDRHREYVTKCEVHMTVNHNPSVVNAHKVTATIGVKGSVIRDSVESDSMYTALDGLADALSRNLRKYKERRRKGSHAMQGTSALRTPSEEDADDEDDEGDMDGVGEEFDAEAAAYAVQITKVKSFSMDPMAPEEAALCLDYIDHPFYVFRNKDSGDVNVLYRRNSGGLGLIEPSSL